ncbi:hypothetical protein [Mesorhizobium sp. M1403]|uniref:hypothetical protein n=2 Tax=Mesorhizobium TaxID=68287 RepID=UPI00333B6B8B
MTEEIALTMAVREAPRFPFHACATCAARSMHVYVFCRATHASQETTMQRRQCRTDQPDLFSKKAPPSSLPGEVRERTLPLIETLLREAVVSQTGREADHEDHR